MCIIDGYTEIWDIPRDTNVKMGYKWPDVLSR